MMAAVSKYVPIMRQNKYFGPATVIEFDEDQGLISLFLDDEGKNNKALGKSAIPYHHKFKKGDKVLASGEDRNFLYVIGLLDQDKPCPDKKNKLRLEKGVYAQIIGKAGNEAIQVCSSEGELLFEYDATNGKSRVNIKSGDLDFITKNGAINFISEQDIRFSSKQKIEMESTYGFRFAFKNTLGKLIPSLNLNPEKVQIDSPEIVIASKRARFNIMETKYVGQKISGTFSQGRLLIGRLETIATDIVQKAKNIYKTVEGVSQLKAGRMRTLVQGSIHVKSKKTFLKTTDDFKVDAKKIHLG